MDILCNYTVRLYFQIVLNSKIGYGIFHSLYKSFNFYVKIWWPLLQLWRLTNPRSDDAQEQQDDGDVGLWHCIRGHVVKKQSVVGPVDRGAVRQEWLIAASSQRISVFFPLADYVSKLRRRGVDEGHQEAEIHGTSRSEHGAHAQQQAAQMEAAWDDACVNQAVRLPESGEHHRAH